MRESLFRGIKRYRILVLVKLILESAIPVSSLESPPNARKDGSYAWLLYGMPCEVKMAEALQLADSNFYPGSKFVESGRICKLSHGLECIPVQQLWNNNGSVGPAQGRCQCILALSVRSIYLTPKRQRDHFKAGCYIPAGFALSSTCGHTVALPFGMTQTVLNLTQVGKTNETLKWISHTSIGDTRKMCVPNAECRTSSKFTGTRCVCHRWTTWNRKDGTCTSHRDLDRNDANLGRIASYLSTIIPMFFCLFGILDYD